MTDPFHKSDSSFVRLDEAVRRATPVSRMALPGRRGMLRASGVYANVFAVLVALGIPNGTLRQAAVGAMASFDGVVRQASAEVAYAASANSAFHIDAGVSDGDEPIVSAGAESAFTDAEHEGPDAVPVAGVDGAGDSNATLNLPDAPPVDDFPVD